MAENPPPEMLYGNQYLPRELEFSSLGIYSFLLPGRTALRTIPTMDATARPEKLTEPKEMEPAAL